MPKRFDFVRLGDLVKTREKEKEILQRAVEGDIDLYFRLDQDSEVWCIIKEYVRGRNRLNAGELIKPKKIDQCSLVVVPKYVLEQSDHFDVLQGQYFERAFCLDENGDGRFLKSMKRNYLPGKSEESNGIDIGVDIDGYGNVDIRAQISEGGVCEAWENENDFVYEVGYSSDPKDTLIPVSELWVGKRPSYKNAKINRDSRYQIFHMPLRSPFNRLMASNFNGYWTKKVVMTPAWTGFSLFNKFSNVNEDLIRLYKKGLKDPDWLGRVSGVVDGGESVDVGRFHTKSQKYRWYLRKSAGVYNYYFAVYNHEEKVTGVYKGASFFNRPKVVEANVKDLIVDRSAYERIKDVSADAINGLRKDIFLGEKKKSHIAEAVNWLEGDNKGLLKRLASADKMVDITSLAIAFWEQTGADQKITMNYKTDMLSPLLDYNPKQVKSLIEMITLEWNPGKARADSLVKVSVDAQPWKDSHLNKVIDVWRDLAARCLASDWESSQLIKEIEKARSDNSLPKRYQGVIRFVMLGNGFP